MKLKLLNTNNLKSYILSNISQEEIFAYYLKVSIEELNIAISNKKKIINNIRYEDNPSLSFIYRGKKLLCKDWGNNNYSGDCFHIASKRLKKNINDKKEFIEVMYHIINNIIHNKIELVDNIVDYDISDVKTKDLKSVLKVSFEIKDYYNSDLRIFSNWGLRYDTLINNKVYCVSRLFFRNKLVYYYRFSDPCYAYYLGIDPVSKTELYEFYFPNREDKKRHWTNNIFTIKYLNEIKDGGTALIICKSRKDCLLLRQILSLLNMDIYIKVTQLHSESTIIDKHIAEYINSKFERVFIFSDFDKAGRLCAYTHKKLYGYMSLFLTNGRFNTKDYFEGKDGKDITDYNSTFNLQKSIVLVKDTIELLKHML